MAFSKTDLLECAHKELSKRITHYPHWIVSKKISRKDADDQIEKMRTIYRLLARVDDSLIAQVQVSANV